MIQPCAGPGLFELVHGEDHIEIVVKTIDLGDSETPTTTLNNSSHAIGAQSTPNNRTKGENRNSIGRSK